MTQDRLLALRDLLRDFELPLEHAHQGPFLGAALRQLRDDGLDPLPLPGGGDTLRRWQALATVAGADLSLLKLYEGHTDALAILDRYRIAVPPAIRARLESGAFETPKPGDARFAGSVGAQHLNAPVRPLVADGDDSGYWLVASDGGVFAFVPQ